MSSQTTVHLDWRTQVQAIMADLEGLPSPSVADRCEYSVMTTTLRKLEELEAISDEYRCILMDQVADTRARLMRERRPAPASDAG